MTKAAEWFLRIALSVGFLSAVADRFGLWGPPGAPGVAWGAWEPFVDYVALLNGFMPAAMAPTLAWLATVLEIIVGVGLVVGWRLRWFSIAAGMLLLSFGVTMTLATGIKGPLDYSVFGVAAGAFLLAAISRDESHARGAVT